MYDPCFLPLKAFRKRREDEARVHEANRQRVTTQARNDTTETKAKYKAAKEQVAAKAEAAIRLVDPLVTSLAEKTAAAELEYRLPVIHASRQSVAAGSLVSYGADGPS